MKVFDHIWLWLILLFAGYVLVAPTPEVRIVRLCEPTNWVGRVLESFTMLVTPEHAPGVRDGMRKFEHGCQSMVYRQMYPAQYEQLRAEAEAEALAAAEEAKKGLKKEEGVK